MEIEWCARLLLGVQRHSLPSTGMTDSCRPQGIPHDEMLADDLFGTGRADDGDTRVTGVCLLERGQAVEVGVRHILQTLILTPLKPGKAALLLRSYLFQVTDWSS